MTLLPFVKGIATILNDDTTGKVQFVFGLPFPKLDGYTPTLQLANQRSYASFE